MPRWARPGTRRPVLVVARFAALSVALLALAACGIGLPPLSMGEELPDDPTPTVSPAPPGDASPTVPRDTPPPLPTIAPISTPGAPPPTPNVSPPASPVAPTPEITPPSGATPGPTVPAPVIELPPELGYDAGDYAVLFTPGRNGNPAHGDYIINKLIAFIDAAQTSVHVAAFETNLTPLAEALIRAHSRGVDVRWVTDDEHGSDSDGDEGHGQFALMEAAGIPVRDDLRSAFMHNKFVIIDGRITWTGSMNLTTNDVYRNNNNVVVSAEPLVAAAYEAEFAEMWAGQFGPRSPSQSGQSFESLEGTFYTVRFAPEDEPFAALVALAGQAQERIRVMAFSFTQDDLGAALMERAAAGVDVAAIFEQRGSETIYSELPSLFCVGIPARQDGNPGTFHHKVIIIDDFVVITGSMNFSDNAADSNDENVLAIANELLAEYYTAEFDRRWAEATSPDIDCE